jgi:hypothetical protein
LKNNLPIYFHNEISLLQMINIGTEVDRTLTIAATSQFSTTQLDDIA